MPHFIARKQLESSASKLDSMPYAYKLDSIRSSNVALIAVPYVYQNKPRLCFVYEITRANDVLLKGVKSLRPIPSGLLKNALQALSKHYDVLHENLAHTALKQNIDSPFLLSDGEIVELLKSSQDTYSQVFVEIGFGSGRHIVHLAKEHRDTLVIGLEIHTPSVEQVLRQIEILDLENLYISCLDARQFLHAAISDSVGQMFIHFPVPWNSAKNRRVLNGALLQEVMRVLKQTGSLEFRTDDREYFEDVLALAQANQYASFTHTINAKQSITSKYEARWLAQEKDIFTITITPNAKTPPRDSREIGQKCGFRFDKKLVKSTLAKASSDCFAHLWEKRRFAQGFLCVYDAFISRAQDRVAFLVHFGDFQYPCTRLIVLECIEIAGVLEYQGHYFPEPPLQSHANAQAHELFINILEKL
ncbi:tRNA (guanosine(46)-N7)-methyltransferase TrmB [Helicobacter canis]|uniref:tRNA (guanosine(46)-N7)-methyltransferase TrmB n=1 Tax=Helicobacter canis TaxID=29419 RepID=UPI0026EF3EFA|nr:tRNA (guanosine(46)-N7)-methyltransferase TrmB [Helicobacter canis]